jgi:hypothetical protein
MLIVLSPTRPLRIYFPYGTSSTISTFDPCNKPLTCADLIHFFGLFVF